MAHANPGLRPGLGSAVPTGLDFEMVVLTHTLKAVPLKEKRTSGPKGLICFGRCGTAEGVPFVRELSAASLVGLRFSELEVDEVAVAEEAEEDDCVEAGVVCQGTKGGPGPDSRDGRRMGNPPLHHKHGDNR